MEKNVLSNEKENGPIQPEKKKDQLCKTSPSSPRVSSFIEKGGD